jgi:hypothetical protein
LRRGMGNVLSAVWADLMAGQSANRVVPYLFCTHLLLFLSLRSHLPLPLPFTPQLLPLLCP